jgi:hypothetical protein
MLSLKQFYLDSCKPIEAELRLKCSNPNVGDWISLIESVPDNIHFVPEENRTLEVFIASVMKPSSKDMLQYFSSEKIVDYLRHIYKKRPEIFPATFKRPENALAFYSRMFTGMQYEMNFQLQFQHCIAEAYLRETPVEDVIECADNKERVLAAKALYGDKKTLQLLPHKHKRYLLEESLGM